MARKELTRFEDWKAEKIEKPDFVAATEALEPGYHRLGCAFYAV